jgi:hypothetical protein
MTGLGQTSEEDDGFRAREMHEVREFLAQQMACIIEDLFGYEIAFFRCVELPVRSMYFGLDLFSRRVINAYLFSENGNLAFFESCIFSCMFFEFFLLASVQAD